MNRIEALAVVIRQTRLQLKMSQEKLAEAAMLHRNAMGRIERSDVAMSVGTLWQIADALGVPASTLLQEAEQLAAKADSQP